MVEPQPGVVGVVQQRDRPVGFTGGHVTHQHLLSALTCQAGR
ncbi:Uncharacterised protein [Mycobacterium tuberculosis]|nr:Uncharacterised protein [Mycobacterium tuberculosis]